jgi:hypothetical protein
VVAPVRNTGRSNSAGPDEPSPPASWAWLGGTLTVIVVVVVAMLVGLVGVLRSCERAGLSPIVDPFGGASTSTAVPSAEALSRIETAWVGLPSTQREALCWDHRPATSIFDSTYVSPAVQAVQRTVAAAVQSRDVEWYLEGQCDRVHVYRAADIRPGWWINVLPRESPGTAKNCNPFAGPDWAEVSPIVSMLACRVDAVEVTDEVRVTYANAAIQDFDPAEVIQRV